MFDTDQSTESAVPVRRSAVAQAAHNAALAKRQVLARMDRNRELIARSRAVFDRAQTIISRHAGEFER